MRTISGESTDVLARRVLSHCLSHGVDEERQAGGWCLMPPGKTVVRELPPTMLVLRDPRRHLTSQHCLGFEMETEDYLLGLNPGFVHHAPGWAFQRRWLTPEGRFPYTYGERGGCQLDGVMRLFDEDLTTRHCVVPLFEHADRRRDFVPCTVVWHLDVRHGKLNWTSVMRSQDLCRGLFLDLFAYPFLQCYVAECLHLRLGEYTHVLLNGHVYNRDLLYAARLRDGVHERSYGGPSCPEPLGNRSRALLDAASRRLFDEAYRTTDYRGYSDRKALEAIEALPPFWKHWKQGQYLWAVERVVTTMAGVTCPLLPETSIT
jgi:hypothetical protein